MEHVDLDGMRIVYTRAGTGPALVMLHGAPSDGRTWQWMARDLARDHTVVAWDAPGFGESSDIDDSWRAPEFADALAAFVAALGLERPHVVGHSFGTMVALSLFQRHRALPSSLVLIGGYAGWAGSLPPDEVARRRDMFVGMAELGDAFDPKSYPGLFSDLIPADRDAALANDDAREHSPGNDSSGGLHRGRDGPPAGAACRRRADACSARRGRCSLAAHERPNAPCGDLDIAARCAAEARTRLHGGGPAGLCDGDTPVRGSRGLNAGPPSAAACAPRPREAGARRRGVFASGQASISNSRPVPSGRADRSERQPSAVGGAAVVWGTVSFSWIAGLPPAGGRRERGLLLIDVPVGR